MHCDSRSFYHMRLLPGFSTGLPCSRSFLARRRTPELSSCPMIRQSVNSECHNDRTGRNDPRVFPWLFPSERLTFGSLDFRPRGLEARRSLLIQTDTTPHSCLMQLHATSCNLALHLAWIAQSISAVSLRGIIENILKCLRWHDSCNYSSRCNFG